MMRERARGYFKKINENAAKNRLDKICLADEMYIANSKRGWGDLNHRGKFLR